MPASRVKPLSSLIFACAALLASATAAEPVTLRVRADSWMPFNGDPAASQPGYVVEFLREIFEPAGIKVDYQVMAWADAVKAAEAGEIDGVICANASEAVRLVVGDEAVAVPKFSLFVRKDNPWQYQNLRSLQQVKLGAVEGYKYWPSIDGYLAKATAPAVTLYQGNTPAAEALHDLAAGKIDAVVESALVFYWNVKLSGQKISDYRAAYTETSEPLYVAFTKNKAGLQFARQLDEGLKHLKTTGRFDAILDRYGFAKK